MSKQLRVLIIDGNPSNIETVTRELERGDYRPICQSVVREKEFKHELGAGKWDVILSEYELPGFNSLLALEILHQRGDDIPFIIFTSVNDEETIVSALKAGAHDFILHEHAGRLLQVIERELIDSESRHEHRRAEKVRDLLLKFSQATLTSRSLEQLLGYVHETISGLMPADNLYVALYDEENDTLSFPYYIDEYDEPPPPTKPGKGLTEYILRSGKSILASPELFEELVRLNEVELIGAPSIDWMGVPLKTGDKIFGVLAVQSYKEGIRYRKEDIEILTFVSDQISMSIERMRTEQAIHEEVAFRKTIESSILAGIFAFDREMYQTYVNPAFCRMVGWSEEELLKAQPPYVYWPSDQIDTITEAFLITTGDDALPSDFELCFQRKNGERFDAYLLVSPLRDTEGSVTGWLASVYDITERKNTEEVIRRQTKRAESLAHMAERLNARLDLQKVLDTVCEETAHALNVHAAVVILYDAEKEWFTLAASYGMPPEYSSRFIPIPKSELPFPPEGSTPLILISDVQANPDLTNAQIFADLNIRTMAVVTMMRDHRIVGNLSIYSFGKERRFSEDELSLLHGMANLAEQAIINARLFEETEHRLEQVHALRAIDLAISASLDLKVTLNILLDHALALLHVDAADILLYNVNSQKLDSIIGRGFHEQVPVIKQTRAGEGFATQAVLERRLIFINDLQARSKNMGGFALSINEGFVSYCAAPLIAKGQVKGVLEIYNRAPIVQNSDWLELLEAMAGQAAIAIDNSSMFEQLQRTNEELILAYDTTLEGWIRAVDLRDKESENHTRQVTDMTLRVSQAMGVKEEDLVHIRRGALLHDVGKIGISDQILRKPGPLSEEEWQVIKQHPVYAYQILQPIIYLRPALEIPYCHHEKWDGSGYPRGLRGEDIPLAARIFAVVDVWDSLRSDSPFRTAWPNDKVLRYIQEQSGKHFDPRVVHVFMNMVG